MRPYVTGWGENVLPGQLNSQSNVDELTARKCSPACDLSTGPKKEHTQPLRLYSKGVYGSVITHNHNDELHTHYKYTLLRKHKEVLALIIEKVKPT